MSGETFRLDDDLQEAVDGILETAPFSEVKGDCRVRAVFSDKEKSRNAGYIKLLPPVLREITDIDYVVVFREPILEAYDEDQKARTLIHELRHILVEENEDTGKIKLKVRKHTPNFCTFPLHEHADSDVTKIYNQIKETIAPLIKKLKKAKRPDATLEEFLTLET